MHFDPASRGLALAGEHFDQLALAVAGNPRDPDDLAGMHVQVQVFQGLEPDVIQPRECRRCGDVVPRKGCFSSRAAVRVVSDLIIIAEVRACRCGVRSLTSALPANLPVRGRIVILVGKFHHLAKLVRDHQYGQLGSPDSVS